MLSVDEALPRPSGAVEDALLRVYVEALTNIATHSGARAVQARAWRRATIPLRWKSWTTAAASTPTVRRREATIRAGA